MLAALAKLDPAGDAMQVRVFPNVHAMDTVGDPAVKGPEPPAPGGVTQPEDDAKMKEQEQSAIQDLPQTKYDAIAEEG